MKRIACVSNRLGSIESISDFTVEEKSDVLNRWAAILIGCFVFLNPFPRVTSIKEICFYTALILTVVIGLRKKTILSFKTPLLVPFAAYAVWAFVGIFFSLDMGNSLHDFYAHLLKYVALYFILINFFNSKKGLSTLSRIVVISTTLFSIMGLIYYYGYLKHPLSTRFGLHLIDGRDFFGETPTNLIGVLTVFSIILAFQLIRAETNRKLKYLLVACNLPLFTATLMTQTRSTLIAMVVSLFIILFKHKRAMLIALSTILLVVLMSPIKDRLTPRGIFGNERIGFYLISYEIIKDYPVFGTGMGIQIFDKVIDRHAYNAKLPEKYQLEKWQVDEFAAPHNMFFSVTTRLGVIGLGLFLYIVFMVLKMCLHLTWKAKDEYCKSWGLCVLAIMGMILVKGFFSPIFSHFTEVAIFTIFSMITVLWVLNNQPEDEGTI